jgi:hypothetical protein
VPAITTNTPGIIEGYESGNKSALENLYRNQSAGLLSRKMCCLLTPGPGTPMSVLILKGGFLDQVIFSSRLALP